MGTVSWQFREKNGRVRVAYIFGGGDHSWKGFEPKYFLTPFPSPLDGMRRNVNNNSNAMNKHADPRLSSEARRRAILEAVKGEDISTQGGIVRALKRRGIHATQASVSRDVARLGLVKVRGAYRRAPGAVPASPDAPLREWVRGLGLAPPNLVVVRTDAGTAPKVGLALDQKRLPEIVGTVAGDDTVFIAVDSAQAGRRLARQLQEIVPSLAKEKAS